MPATVDKEKCTGCGLCVEVCLAGAISLTHQEEIEIETVKCLECGTCENECPDNAITVIQESEAMLPTKKTQITSSSNKESQVRFSPPRAVPSDESLIREVIPNTSIFLNRTYPESLGRELSSLIREKITTLWGILGSAIRKAFSATSQNGNVQGRIDRPISNGRRRHRHRRRR